MKSPRLFLFILIAAVIALSITGCVRARTLPGDLHATPCLGVRDARYAQPNVTYRVSTRNVILATLFSPLVAPPLIVLMDATRCPVTRSPAP